MGRSRYRITFAADVPGGAGTEDVDADQVGHIHDGAVAWLNFHDGAGEVLRLRSDSVERVQRIR